MLELILLTHFFFYCLWGRKFETSFCHISFEFDNDSVVADGCTCMYHCMYDRQHFCSFIHPSFHSFIHPSFIHPSAHFIHPFIHWLSPAVGYCGMQKLRTPCGSPGLSKVPSVEPGVVALHLLCLLPGPLAYQLLPPQFILLHFLHNLFKQRQPNVWNCEKTVTC